MTTDRTLKIVALGEILWDMFPDGARFGGAPANFACSAAQLAPQRASVSLVSAVGDDQLGRDALAALQARNVDTTHVRVSPRPTGQVLVEVDPSGQASYKFAADTAWDDLAWDDQLAELAGEADAVCFGSLGQRSGASRDVIQRVVEATRPESLRIFDVNLRPPHVDVEVLRESLELANALKLNEQELPQLAGWCEVSGDGELELLRGLAEKFGLRAAALTRGDDGAVLLAGDDIDRAAAVETEVIDTVGAGDSFTAAWCLGTLRGKSLEETNRWASQVAAYVCASSGATPPLPQELQL